MDKTIIEKQVREIIKDMFRDGSLRIETWVNESNWGKDKLITEVIAYKDEQGYETEVLAERSIALPYKSV